ncbi:hypothetical protein AgCh_024307 [Apium graveolens]
MSNADDVKQVDGHVQMNSENSSTRKEDHERAYFDSTDWALGKQGAEKPKGLLEALRPKLQVTTEPGFVAIRMTSFW